MAPAQTPKHATDSVAKQSGEEILKHPVMLQALLVVTFGVGMFYAGWNMNIPQLACGGAGLAGLSGGLYTGAWIEE